ncbi:unnamed protein product [Ixodes persulcatus]
MPAHCVANGCTNYFYGKGNTKFFRFPSARLYPAKREAWIAAVRRRNTDGSPWQPNEHCRICSAHFVTGRPSTFQNHPDFVPTIFSHTKDPGEVAAGDLAVVASTVECSTSATSTSDVVLTGATLDDNHERSTGARNSSQEEPEGFHQGLSIDQATAAAECYSSTANTCDILFANASSNDVFGADKERPKCSASRQTCTSTISRGTRTPLWGVSKGMQTEQPCNTYTRNQATTTSSDPLHHDVCPDDQSVLAVAGRKPLEDETGISGHAQ